MIIGIVPILNFGEKLFLQFWFNEWGNLKKKVQLLDQIGSKFVVGLCSIKQNNIVESAISSQFE